MDDFQSRVETALYDVFDRIPPTKREVRAVAEQASQLQRRVNNNENYDLELTVDLIVTKMEERSVGGPKWAWNNWIGSMEFFNGVPEGYQV